MIHQFAVDHLRNREIGRSCLILFFPSLSLFQQKSCRAILLLLCRCLNAMSFVGIYPNRASSTECQVMRLSSHSGWYELLGNSAPFVHFFRFQSLIKAWPALNTRSHLFLLVCCFWKNTCYYETVIATGLFRQIVNTRWRSKLSVSSKVS